MKTKKKILVFQKIMKKEKLKKKLKINNSQNIRMERISNKLQELVLGLVKKERKIVQLKKKNKKLI